MNSEHGYDCFDVLGELAFSYLSMPESVHSAPFRGQAPTFTWAACLDKLPFLSCRFPWDYSVSLSSPPPPVCTSLLNQASSFALSTFSECLVGPCVFQALTHWPCAHREVSCLTRLPAPWMSLNWRARELYCWFHLFELRFSLSVPDSRYSVFQDTPQHILLLRHSEFTLQYCAISTPRSQLPVCLLTPSQLQFHLASIQ